MTAADEFGEFTWTGRVKLSATPKELMRFDVTYWQMDEDQHQEAILVSGGGAGIGYMIFDLDAEGWWYVGRESVSTRGSTCGFRVRNWPDERGPRSVVFEDASGWGTEQYFQGITVFRLSKGRLTHVLTSEVWGDWMAMGGGRPPTHGYMQSFVREEPRRILVAHREIRRTRPFEHGAPLSAFRAAKVASCVEHLPSGTKREVAVSECAQVSAAMRGID